MSIEKQMEIAKGYGWNRLGEFEIEYSVGLTESEKLELGMQQAEAVAGIEDLEGKKKVFNDEIKSKIEQYEDDLRYAAKTLRIGRKLVVKKLPCFFDPNSEQRIFIDPETGGIIEKRSAEDGDRQIRIIV